MINLSKKISLHVILCTTIIGMLCPDVHAAAAGGSGFSDEAIEEKLRSTTPPLIPADAKKGFSDAITGIVKEIPAENRGTFVAQSLRLMTKDADLGLRILVTNTLRKIPDEAGRETFINQILRLSSEEDGTMQRNPIIYAFSLADSADESPELEKIFLKFTPKEMSRIIRKDILAVLGKVEGLYKKDFVIQITRLNIPDMPGYTKDGAAILSFVNRISQTPSEERQNLVDQVLRLKTDDLNTDQLLRIINAVKGIPHADRERFVNQVLRLNTVLADQHRSLNTLARMPAEERDSFINEAYRIITRAMDPEEQFKILDNIRRTPSARRHRYVNGLILSRYLRNASPEARASITEVIRQPPLDEARDRFVDQVAELIKEGIMDYELRRIVEASGAERERLINEFLLHSRR